MTSFLRVMFPAAIAALLVATSAGPSDAVVRDRRTFDGVWSVSIVTYQGECNHSYRYPLRIWYGRVVKADADPNYQVSGTVARTGHIAVTVSGNGQAASGTGRLTENDGAGIWHSTDGQCSGRWTARRRAEN